MPMCVRSSRQIRGTHQTNTSHCKTVIIIIIVVIIVVIVVIIVIINIVII